ncbi:MAG: wax ester/triacylglycerol synthase domain-containing protein [Acidimicrobiales bacterium]
MSDAFQFEPQMSDVEALMWSVEDHEPLLRSTIVIVVHLAEGLSFERVERHVERVTRLLPRFKDKVVSSPVPGVNPRWVPDASFDLPYHLRRVVAPPPANFDTSLRLAEPMAAEGLDKARPPWQMLFVEGLAGSRSALVVKIHHSLTDGIGLVKLGLVLFDLEPDPGPEWSPTQGSTTDGTDAREAAAESERDPLAAAGIEPNSFDRMLDDLSHELQRGVSMLRQFAPLVATGVREILSDPEPGPQAQALLEMLRSAARVAAPTARALSPLMTGRSMAGRLAVIEVALDDAVRMAKAAGGTVNDVYLASVTAGLEEYHRRHGSTAVGVRIGVPINTRTGETDFLLRNQVSAVRVLAPFGVDDPIQRIRLLHDLVAQARSEPAIGLVEAIAGVANRLPMLRSLVGAAVGALDAVVSNVPGPGIPLYIGGAQVLGMIGFGPRGGAALNVTMGGHIGDLKVAVNADLAAAPDVEVLFDSLRQGFTQTLRKPPRKPQPRRRTRSVTA